MLSTEEEKFLKYWEQNRNKERKVRNQILIGLPIGLLFGLPVLLNLFIDWNEQVRVVTRGQFNVLLFAVLIIVSFISIFSVRHKWDLKEQYYKELLFKKNKSQKNA